MKVCVLGLGEVGLSTAKYILSRDIEVWGYDISPNAIKNARDSGICNATSNWDEVPDAEVYVICVSTTLRESSPDVSSVFRACERIAEKNYKPSLISIESTIVPGTSRRVYEEIFDKQAYLVHVPHRYWKEDPIKYGVRQVRVIGAINKESLRRGLKFYKECLDIPLHIAPSVEVAEMSKIAENAYRYVQIAFAEELRIICEELKLDFEEVRRACNTKWNIEILEARDGIKGHCLPKDVRYLISLTSFKSICERAVDVDSFYRKWIARNE